MSAVWSIWRSMPASMRRDRRIAGQYEVTEATRSRSGQSSSLRNLIEQGWDDRQEAKLTSKRTRTCDHEFGQSPSNRRAVYNEPEALSPVRFEHSGLCYRFFTCRHASV